MNFGKDRRNRRNCLFESWRAEINVVQAARDRTRDPMFFGQCVSHQPGMLPEGDAQLE